MGEITVGIKRNLIGKRFGKLTVVGKEKETVNRYCVWHCRCDCGNEVNVNTKQLQRGTVSNCGCVPKTNARNGCQAENLEGRRFGSLTVIRRVENVKGRTCWLCQCDCGNQTRVIAKNLKAGKVKSCGCMPHKMKRYVVDIANERFGRLTALYPTKRRDNKGSVYWQCICDCGQKVEVTENCLVHGNYRSCGCLQKEIQDNIPNQLQRVDGTCIEWLEKRKFRSDNTSGFRGVYRTKNGRYRVTIGFKKKRFYIGTYGKYEEAVEARLEIEHLIHDGFVQAYYDWKKKAEQDEVWAEENPLQFEVERRNGDLYVINSMEFE